MYMMAQDVIVSNAHKHTQQQRFDCTFDLDTSGVIWASDFGQGWEPSTGSKTLMKILDILSAMNSRT